MVNPGRLFVQMGEDVENMNNYEMNKMHKTLTFEEQWATQYTSESSSYHQD